MPAAVSERAPAPAPVVAAASAPNVDAVSGVVSGAAHEAATAKSMEALQTQQSLLDKQIARWTQMLSGAISQARKEALEKKIDDASTALDKIDDKLLQLI